MNKGRMWLTLSADPARSIPAGADERRWQIDAALSSLGEEERRLVRLGFELPLARCQEQRRFWSFVRALHQIDPAGFSPSSRRIA